MTAVLSLLAAGHPPSNPLPAQMLPGSPDPSQLPGTSVLINLTNGIEAWALIASLAGVVVGAVIWAFGHYSQNYHQAYNGRKGVIVSALAALLVGGAPYLIRFFELKGSGLK
jgi:MFS family permease